MNNFLKLLVLFAFVVAATAAFSQQTSPYQVATWPGNRSCAISYTFDDGCSGQFTKAIPIFDEFGYKLTLFTVANWVENWSNLKTAAENGHEVANHTFTHPQLDTLTVAEQKTELKTSNDLINTNVPSQKSITMATPYCVTGKDSLERTFFIAVRGCQGYIESKTPGNFMNVSSVICGTEGSVKKTNDFKIKANSAATSKGWLVYLIHGIDNDGGWSPLSSDTLRQSLVYLKDNDSKFWVTTFVNAARYIKERNCASFTETASTDTSCTVTVTDTLSNNAVFNYPLTIMRVLPEDWSDAKVTRNDIAIADTVVEINSVKYVLFDVVPDGSSVVITKVKTVGNKDKTGYRNNDLKIGIQKNSLTIQAPSTCAQQATVSVYNIMGQLMLKTENINLSSGQCTISPLPFKFSGIYFVRLTADNATWTKKIQWL